MLFAAVKLALLFVGYVQAGLPQAPPPQSTNPSAPLLALPPALPPLPPPPPPINDYGFRYAVNDFKGNEHSHQQRRVGNAVTGQYKVLLPDGRLQTVTYIADEGGYRAKVDYTPARPGEATTAGLATPPILAQQPPLLAGLLNAPFQRTGVEAVGPLAKETEELIPKASVLIAAKPERTLGVETVDVERLDMADPPEAKALQRESPARMLAPALATGLLDSSRIVSSVYNGNRRNDNNRAARIRLSNNNQESRPRFTDSPFNFVSRFAD